MPQNLKLISEPVKNLLLDRDGTLIQDKHYLSQPEEVELIPGAGSALEKLSQQNINLFLLSNQSGINRGYFTLKDHQQVQKKLDSLLFAYGVTLKDQSICPHTPEESCNCRKPKTGLWKSLEKKHCLNPLQTAMVGDKIADLLFGINAGLALSILVLTGKGRSQAQEAGIKLPKGLNSDIQFKTDTSTIQMISNDLASVSELICKLNNRQKKDL